MYSELHRAKKLATDNGHHVVAEILDEAMLETSDMSQNREACKPHGIGAISAVWTALGLGSQESDVGDIDAQSEEVDGVFNLQMLERGGENDCSSALVSPHVCQTCGLTVSNGSSLRRHERIHTGVRDFECEICFCTFARKDTLDKHTARQHQQS